VRREEAAFLCVGLTVEVKVGDIFNRKTVIYVYPETLPVGYDATKTRYHDTLYAVRENLQGKAILPFKLFTFEITKRFVFEWLALICIPRGFWLKFKSMYGVLTDISRRLSQIL